jgi:uncharacterized protein YjbJ (UPF0337 family)
MGEFIDKAKGAANQAIGKAKVEVGRAVDSPAIMLGGAKQEVKGKAQSLAGEIEGVLADKIAAHKADDHK